MEINFGDVCTGHKPKASPLRTKKDLMNYKKEGLIFFSPNMSELAFDDRLELYFYGFPNDQTQVDSFPVPTQFLEHHKDEHSQFLYLKNFFETYYAGTPFEKEIFYTYDFHKPFVGEKYCWYSKKSHSYLEKEIV